MVIGAGHIGLRQAGDLRNVGSIGWEEWGVIFIGKMLVTLGWYPSCLTPQGGV